ncbi:hypothetical protein Back2_12780 [Nocardioides baekrokdamisoli]|uniref:Uncharacterized protein n=1 Tax=Nocardioides baekrokdamisoli TaxID=1804624 RepID=A0A3G9ITN7_9ACTN|nr:hypothetical protein [Nocardioides baekrokdamisoli]BBH16991.1 hypothetical protein Back2_12780 [Nocardioides baekrokdamisoli]
MRTTLDLDPRVLAAARGRVQAGSSPSVGAAVSELALAGIDLRMDVTFSHGLLLAPPVEGHVITSDMVEDALADD